MLNNKTFTVSIGEYGIIVALHQGKNVLNKILLASLTDENKPQIESLFSKNSLVPVYILLDTVEQNYKRKSYPPVSSGDFNKIVKRDLKKEFENSDKSLQSYLGVRDKISKKWECTFVSVNCQNEVNKWIEFLLSVRNRLAGIYLLPVESQGFANAVFDLVKTDLNLKITENSILSLIVQNKISGFRQIVFSNQSIIFTRVVNYNSDDPQFVVHFEQDIFRANEYLKMIFPKLKAQDVININILSDDVISKITQSQNRELNFINQSPSYVAGKFNLVNAAHKNSSFSDAIIANFFANNKKKILKFTNHKISVLEKLYLAIKSAFIINAVLAFIIIFTLAKTLIINYISDKKILQISQEKILLEQQFESINSAALEGENNKKDNNKGNNLASEIIDFGKIDELLGKNSANINEIFGKLSFLKNYKAVASSFSFQMPSYDPKAESFSHTFKFAISGNMFDSNGDVENLLKKFDALSLETKNKFTEYNVKFSEVPKGIDFSKKYDSFPFDVTIENK